MRVFRTAEFSKFTRKARIEDASLIEAIKRAERGLIDADLGGGIVKLRIARPNEGRSGGYRTIVALVLHARALFLHGYAKNDFENVNDRALIDFREAGAIFQRLDEARMAELIEKGRIVELLREDR